LKDGRSDAPLRGIGLSIDPAPQCKIVQIIGPKVFFSHAAEAYVAWWETLRMPRGLSALPWQGLPTLAAEWSYTQWLHTLIRKQHSSISKGWAIGSISNSQIASSVASRSSSKSHQAGLGRASSWR
jgi:hypothetical protein